MVAFRAAWPSKGPAPLLKWADLIRPNPVSVDQCDTDRGGIAEAPPALDARPDTTCKVLGKVKAYVWGAFQTT